MADIVDSLKNSLRDGFKSSDAWAVYEAAGTAQSVSNSFTGHEELLWKKTIQESEVETSLDALIAGYAGTEFEGSVRAFAEHAYQNPDLMTEIGAVLANNDKDGFLVVAGMAQSGAPADTAQAIAHIDQFSKANTENRDDMSIKEGVMWLVDNGLYNTQKSWYSGENLLNIGFLGVSAVAGAFSGGTGTAAMVGTRLALTAPFKAASRVALTEAVENFAVKPALKGAVVASVVEPLATAPVMGVVVAPALSAATNAMNEDMANDETTLDEGTNLSTVSSDVTMYGADGYGYPEPATEVVETPTTIPHVPKKSETSELVAETATETPELSTVEKAYEDTVANLETWLAPIIPDAYEDFIIDLCAMFQMATMGDGNDATHKMDELSFLGNKFMEAVIYKTPSQDVPAPANIDKAPEKGMALAS